MKYYFFDIINIGDRMKKIKKLFKEHSPYLIVLTSIEIIISIISILAFVYSDSLNYNDSIIYQSIGLETLLETMYSSTWWSLILFTLLFISICHLTGLVYKKKESIFMGICGWFALMIISINIGNPLTDTISKLVLFIPVILINIISYKQEIKKYSE